MNRWRSRIELSLKITAIVLLAVFLTGPTPDLRAEGNPNFNLAVKRPPQVPSPFPVDGLTNFYADLAQSILDDTGITTGYCLDYGCGDGRLAYERAMRSDLHVIGVSESAEAIATGRAALRQAGPRA